MEKFPLLKRIPFRHMSASAYVNQVDEKMAVVSNLHSKVKRQGHATTLMWDIVRFADEHGWVLLIKAQTFEIGGIPSNRQLMVFYETFGFTRRVECGREIKMIRYPSRKIHDL